MICLHLILVTELDKLKLRFNPPPAMPLQRSADTATNFVMGVKIEKAARNMYSYQMQPMK